MHKLSVILTIVACAAMGHGLYVGNVQYMGAICTMYYALAALTFIGSTVIAYIVTQMEDSKLSLDERKNHARKLTGCEPLKLHHYAFESISISLLVMTGEILLPCVMCLATINQNIVLSGAKSDLHKFIAGKR